MPFGPTLSPASKAIRWQLQHLQFERVGFDGFNPRIFAVYRAQPPRNRVHAVKSGHQPERIVDRNFSGIVRKTLHVNQPSGLVDDVSARKK